MSWFRHLASWFSFFADIINCVMGNEEARWDRQLYYFKYILLQIRRTQGQWRQDLAIYLADSTYLADDQQLHNGQGED